MAGVVPLPDVVRIENAWLITGPSTMPRHLRQRCGLLTSYWKLVRDGLRKVGRGKWSHVTRDVWLSLDSAQRHRMSLCTWYAPEKIEAIAYKGHPFLAWLPKCDVFGANA